MLVSDGEEDTAGGEATEGAAATTGAWVTESCARVPDNPAKKPDSFTTWGAGGVYFGLAEAIPPLDAIGVVVIGVAPGGSRCCGPFSSACFC